MAGAELMVIAADAVASIEDIGGRIEHAFAEVGGHLGRTHTIFSDLNSGLSSVSEELSGPEIEDACVAFQDIAGKLLGLAYKLPLETALLEGIGSSAAQASLMLRQLLKHIHMVTVIARSSKIEAASLDGNRTDFLSFTAEASNLATSVQNSMLACAKDQESLSDAITATVAKQAEFDKHYRPQLFSVSSELLLASSEIKDRQTRSAELAESTRAGTSRIGASVGSAIVSLQAGDSTRQRLEHICHGLRFVSDADISIAPGAGTDTVDPAALAPPVCLLQAAQLEDAAAGFDIDIVNIARSLTQLSADSTEIAGRGRSLIGGRDDNATSFLDVMRQRVNQARALIAACGNAMQSVGSSIGALEAMIGNFRAAISTLDEIVIDITLIGMNAALKASHLGEKGRAFVVIAKELQLTADRISASAKLLEPLLDHIGGAADHLKCVQTETESVKATDLESRIVGAIHKIELGNGRLDQMIQSLMRESEGFEVLMTNAKDTMSALGERFSTLPEIARRLAQPNHNFILSRDLRSDAGGLFDKLYLQYTMDAERDVHLKCAGRLQLPHTVPDVVPADDSEDALFF
jgi:methyl-accepting chemotaxis protein